MARTEPYRILAVDGGGIGGMLPARLIERIAEKHPALLEKTDLFAGTSTGGLISLGLAKGLSPSELVKVYRDDSEKIFGWNTRRWKPQQLWNAKYSPSGLQTVVRRIVGPTKLGELSKPVFIPVVALKRADKAHYPAGIFLSTAHRLAETPPPEFRRRFDDWLCYDAGMATSAAPTYFPAHVVADPGGKGSWTLWDGGLVANNPGLAAVCELSRYVSLEPDLQVRILSLGTGYQNIDIDAGDWGTVNAVRPIISTLMDVSVGSTNFYLRTFLNDKVLRLTPPLDPSYDMDDASAVPRLEKVADAVDLDERRPSGTPGRSFDSVVDWLKENW